MKAMLCKPVAVASWVAVALKWLQHHRRGDDDCDRVRTCIHCVEYFLHQPRKTSSSSDRGCPKIPILQFFSKLFKLGGTEDGLTWVATSDTFASKKIPRGYGSGLSSPPYGICAYLRHFFLGWPLYYIGNCLEPPWLCDRESKLCRRCEQNFCRKYEKNFSWKYEENFRPKYEGKLNNSRHELPTAPSQWLEEPREQPRNE